MANGKWQMANGSDEVLISDEVLGQSSNEVCSNVNWRKIQLQRELARMMHRKQIEEGLGEFKKAPTHVLRHAGTFLDHEIKTKLKF